MDTQKFPPFTPFLTAAIVLALIGWGGLVALIVFTLPTLGPRWLFFFLATLAASGTALPVAYFLNRRFISKPPVDAGVIVRQSLWVGIFADLMIWLQLGSALTIPLAIMVASGLVIIELILRLRERSRFQVEAEEQDE